jgi:hypothetical protein
MLQDEAIDIQKTPKTVPKVTGDPQREKLILSTAKQLIEKGARMF